MYVDDRLNEAGRQQEKLAGELTGTNPGSESLPFFLEVAARRPTALVGSFEVKTLHGRRAVHFWAAIPVRLLADGGTR